MRKESLVVSSAATLAVLLVVALVVMVNWLGARHYVRGDWTGSKLYTLSEKSVNVLRGVDTDVKVVVFMTPQTPLFGEVKELLSRYQAASPRIAAEFIDPDRDPLRTQQLASQYGVSAANTVVFVAGERSKYVTSDQLAEYDYSGVQYGQTPKMQGFKGEEQFTSAILAVANPRQPKIYFTTGHGEHDPEGFAEDSLGRFAEALKRDNFLVAKVNLLAGTVPEDCDVLAIAGPDAPFAEAEIATVQGYLAGGGRVLLLLDPVLGGRMRPSGLEGAARQYGVEFGDNLVIDPERRVPFIGLESVYAADFRGHPVVDGMEGLAVLLPIARSATTTAASGVKSTQLFTTSAGGWGETDVLAIVARQPIDKDDRDLPGPVSLGVASEPEEEGEQAWRLVAVGDSDFLTNASVDSLGNLALGLNAVNWLARREASLGIPPRQPEQVQLYLSATQMRTITLVSLLGLPGAAVALGVFVWWRRRR